MSNILIVEDSIDLTHMYVQLFAAYRHNVTVVRTGKNLEVVIEEFKPDLILLDIYLTREDGRDIFKELKQTHSAIPIIMVSASLNLKEKYIACGADDYVAKPFDVKNLMDKISKWTQVKS
ncbi:MAG: response regulator [Ferruginibacter sp.]|uniref:response regulator transcription factor n=1 Tax=Ferruginibacter sp. TaxID=1940288 RepID=UPI002658DA97|nr:response regulator [Ferruginibacter sp.]MDB5280687.1 response regulator [Ferruginibacter sp.]